VGKDERRAPGGQALTYLKAVKALEALYAELPQMECTGQCESYCGPLVMTRTEFDLIKQETGVRPTVNQAEKCIFLRNGRCSIYNIRPLICRMWGQAENIMCPWGCKSERPLTQKEGQDFINRASEICHEWIATVTAQRGKQLIQEEHDKSKT